MIEKLLAMFCLLFSSISFSAILRLLIDGNLSIFFETVDCFIVLSAFARLIEVSVMSKDLKRDINLALSDGLFQSLP
jgi:hypothetical protein